MWLCRRLGARPLTTSTVVWSNDETRVATTENIKVVAYLVLFGSAKTNKEGLSDIDRRHAILTSCVRGIAVTLGKTILRPRNLCS